MDVWKNVNDKISLLLANESSLVYCKEICHPFAVLMGIKFLWKNVNDALRSGVGSKDCTKGDGLSILV